MSTQNSLTQHKASSEQIRSKVDIPVLRLISWRTPGWRQALQFPEAKLLLSCNPERKKKKNPHQSHVWLSKHNYTPRMAQGRYSCHAIKPWISYRREPCVRLARLWLGSARARPAAEVCLLSSLPSSALSAIRLPLLLLQPITQASLCCAKSCSCSNTPGKSSLKHVRMRGPVW